MVWTDGKAFGLFLPTLADVFIGSEPSEGFASLSEIVRHQERVEVLLQVLMGLVIVFVDRGFLEGTIHALHLVWSMATNR